MNALGRVIRAATFNVHSFVGRDRRRDVPRSLDAIRSLSADVIAMQEVLLPGADVDRILQEKVGDPLGMRTVAGSSLLRRDAAYGNALATSLPVLSVRRHDISVPGREPRGVVDVHLDAAGKTLRVAATHFGLHRKERRIQTRMLLDILGAKEADILILLGDFNEWLPLNRSVRLLDVAFGRHPAPPTFPSHAPVLALDRIWVCPGNRLHGIRVVKSAAAKASDHLPLVADILVGPGPPGLPPSAEADRQ